jgi:hypothetical protein
MIRFQPVSRDVMAGTRLGAVRMSAQPLTFEPVYRCETAQESPR